MGASKGGAAKGMGGGIDPGVFADDFIPVGSRETPTPGGLLGAIGTLQQGVTQQQPGQQPIAPQGPQTPGMMPWGTPGAMPMGQASTGPLAGMRPQYNQPISNGGGMQSPYGGMPNMTRGYGQQGQQQPANAYQHMINQRLRRGGH